jgi:hypothetical protein
MVLSISKYNTAISFVMQDFLILVFNPTFSNISAISWQPVLVVEEAEVPNQIHPRNLSWLPQIANGCDDITEILLKVALNTIALLCQMKMSCNNHVRR